MAPLARVECLWMTWNVSATFRPSRAAAAPAAAVAHSGRVSGELNAHVISNWIFNQLVSSLSVMNNRPSFSHINQSVLLSSVSPQVLQIFCFSPHLKVPEMTWKAESFLSNDMSPMLRLGAVCASAEGNKTDAFVDSLTWQERLH